MASKRNTSVAAGDNGARLSAKLDRRRIARWQARQNARLGVPVRGRQLS